MGGWLNQMAQFMDLWMIRIAVLSSFAAHLVLVLLAGIRRHKASGGRVLLLWLAYQLANWSAAYAIGNLSFGSMSQQHPLLVAFWVPFLLQHLGGPDNMSGYSLEDNVLSGRQALNVLVQVGGAIYVVYKHIYIGGGDTALLWASIIILAAGVAKYVERVLALWQGNLGSIRSSCQKKQPSKSTDGSSFRKGGVLDDEQALMVAHSMFPFCQRAMTDSSVDMDSPDRHASREMFSFGWESMCKVVEMELSLMYDILYTKAAMVHSWGGYFIRFISPLGTVAAFVLFLLYSKDRQRRADVIITYTLLAATFMLDMRWLFRALGSTWTHAFLQARLQCSGSPRLWQSLRRVTVCLDLSRLALRKAPSSYRMWSGTIGQFNLLHECTHDTMTVWGRAANKIGLEEAWKEHHHSERLKLSEDVKRLVFERLQKILKSTYEVIENNGGAGYSMNDITTSWGQVTAKRRHQRLRRFRLGFGREFQEDILAWHIATHVFLLLVSHQSLIQGNAHAKAIKVLSDYMMFLVAVRSQMLPGLVLLSLYEVTFEALRGIWGAGADVSSSSELTTTGREEKLASTLRDKMDEDGELGLVYDSKTRLVLDGLNIAMVLLDANESEMPELLELVFDVWVDKLLYAGTRCSRESHAKQLGRGGELTTIVWILAEHVGPFQIGRYGPDHKAPKPRPLRMYHRLAHAPKPKCEPEPWPPLEEPAPPPPEPEVVLDSPPPEPEPAPPLFEPEPPKEQPAPPPPEPKIVLHSPATEPEAAPPLFEFEPEPPKKEEPAPPPLEPVKHAPPLFETPKAEPAPPPPEPEPVPPPAVDEIFIPLPWLEPEPLRRYATLYPVD